MTYPQQPTEGVPYNQQPQPWPTQPPAPKKTSKPWLIGAIVFVVGLFAMVAVAAVTDNPSSDQPAAASTADRDENGVFDRHTEQRGEPADEPTEEPEPEPEPEPTEPAMTLEQEQAVGTAQDYLRYSSFSRQGLIDQLEFEGFSNADATFGVDYLDVDWMEQAVISAQSYMDNVGGFSRESLIGQLEFEGFTRKQAEHGANEVGL